MICYCQIFGVMYASLGDIVFDGLKSPTSFQLVDAAVYAEHQLLNTKSILQPTGLQLKQGSIDIILHQSFCIVKDELKKITDHKNNFDVLTLLRGDGTIEGDFVITTITRREDDALENGAIVQTTLTVELLEFFVPDKLVVQQQQARDNAPAVGDKKPPVQSKRTNTPTCPGSISNANSALISNAQAVNYIVSIFVINQLQCQRILSGCKNIIITCNTLDTINNAPGSCTTDIKAELSQRILAVRNCAEDLGTLTRGLIPFFTDPSTPEQKAQAIQNEKFSNDALQAAVNVLTGLLTPLIQKSVTRTP